jgi:thymidylate kinase
VLIALEGIDGSGKSTAARRLVAALPGAELLDRWSLPLDEGSYPGRQMSRLREVLWPADLGSRGADELGRHYWVFLQAAWYSVLERALAARSGAGIVVADGWWFRLVAKAARGEPEREWMESLFAGVRKPDLTLLLDVDPRLAWGRRGEFKSFELGRWNGQAGGARDGFCAFQGSVRERLLEQAHREGWRVVAQGSATTPEELAERLIEHVAALAGGRRAEGGRR